MARIRTIKPEFWDDEAVGILSVGARLLYIGTWNLADDEGRLRWTPEYVGSALFMYDNLSREEIARWMLELERLVFVVPYSGGKTGQKLAWIPQFLKHQRINRPTPSKLPEPPKEIPPVLEVPLDSLLSHGGLHVGKERNGRERKGKDLAPSERKQDPLWDALMYVCRIDTAKITKSARGAYNRAVKELKEVDATPESIAHAAMAYRLAYGDVALTPSALAKHYAGAEGVATQPKVSKGALEIAQWVNDTDS